MEKFKQFETIEALLREYTDFLFDRYNICGVPDTDRAINEFTARLLLNSQSIPPYISGVPRTEPRSGPRRKRGLDNETTDNYD